MASLPSPAMTLWQFWHMTQANDPRLQVYRRQLDVAAQARPLALAALLPNITAQSGIQWASNESQELYNSFNIHSPLYREDSNSQDKNWSVQIRQALFNWTALQQYQASDEQVAAAAAQYQQAFQDLEKKAIIAYTNWLLAYANMQTLQSAEKGFAHQVSNALARYHAGVSGILGSEEASVALANVQAQLAEAQARWQSARATIQRFTGEKSPLQPPPLPRNIPLDADNLRHWKVLAMQHNPTLASARDQLAASRRVTSAAWGGFLPTLTLILAHQWQSQQETLDYHLPGESAYNVQSPYKNLGNSIGLQIRWSIFLGGAQQAALAQAQYQQEENFSNVLATQRSIEATLRQNYAHLRAALRQTHLYRHALALAVKASTAATDGVPARLVTENNAIIDRQNALNVRNALNSANASALSSYARLGATAGILTPTQIKNLSGLLNQSEGS
ncbi:TolC family protein [Acidithiobacillus thiooxidans]|uniref:Alkaline protease secretion protein AprF n=1 Tax=Acidithiobacillus thiooxidans ATCC 19377 TaxID=637390 RepID=A0A543PZL2_ACITH|nr:TolC family protein [Acidithiobacillus thiooxidans]MDX5935841.1 TolC family protein [Acidithiobacillus thiooxidans]TQN49518.1 Alkaline protease secretion protein AprF [Acidithiobacillus thiooxidans ATCC 19377]